MKKSTLTFFTLLCAVNFINAQIVYESGYIVTNEGKRIDCLILNGDWLNNPNKFKYKISADSPEQVAPIDSVSEFVVNGQLKYIRAEVKIDRSTDINTKIGMQSAPTFHDERLFLKVLVEGKGTLYSYKELELDRFFFKVEGTSIEQLVYKRYYTPDKFAPTNSATLYMAQNNAYQQQLFVNLKCPSIDVARLKQLRYNERDLKKIFVSFNETCGDGQKSTVIGSTTKRSLFRLSLRPGVNVNNLGLRNLNGTKTDYLGPSTGFRLGLEGEFLLPFNKNKIALIVEPTFQAVSGNSSAVKLNYTSVEVPFSVRYYFYLNENSRLFLNAGYTFDFFLNSTINNLAMRGLGNSFVGGGYKLNRLGFEYRFGFSRDLLIDYPSWWTDSKTMSFIFSYTILK